MKTVFFGSSEFSIPVLEQLLCSQHLPVLVVTQPDKQQGRGKKLLPNRVKTFALEHGIPVVTPSTLRNEETEKCLQKTEYDVAIVASYGKIIPKALLCQPHYGYINVHSSLLPQYRGASPIHAALLHNDKLTGITIMQMDEGLDTGALFSKIEVEIEKEDDIFSLTDKLAEAGGRELIRVLNQLPNGTIIPKPQNENEATYTGKITKKDGNIDWSNSAEELLCKARAYKGWPGLSSFYKGKKVFFEKIKIAEPIEKVDDCKHAASPGEIVFSDRSSFLVQTGKGLISPVELKVAGKGQMPVRAFIAGYRPTAGEKFTETP